MISEVHAQFLLSPITVQVAARDERNIPTVMRGVGCRLTADRQRIDIFLRARQCPDLIANLRQNQMIAVTITRPSTHQSIQFKGSNAIFRTPETGDRAVVEAHAAAFLHELLELGYPRELMATALLPGWTDDILVVSFTPDAVFEQTPGRNAGQQLAPSS